jgi:predicted nuclease with RNAse H fold
MDGVARSVSASNLLAERRLVFEKMSSMGIDVIETTPVEMTPNLLNTYLAIKAKELI